MSDNNTFRTLQLNCTTFGAWTRITRQLNRLTLRDLSKRTGLSISYLSDVENEKITNVGLESAEHIASNLGCYLWEALKEIQHYREKTGEGR